MHKLASITDFIRSTFQEPTEFIPLHDPRFIGNEKKYMSGTIYPDNISLKEPISNFMIVKI